MTRRLSLFALILLAATLCAPRVEATVFLTQEQALASAFPSGVRLERQTIFLTGEQTKLVRARSGVQPASQLVIRYVGRTTDATIAGYVYFDTHRVRTLPETLMFIVSPDGKIVRTEILSFNEPHDYLPKRRWLDQLTGRRLDGELQLNRGVRPISGASLSGRAIVDASRRMLAVHEVIGAAKVPAK